MVQISVRGPYRRVGELGVNLSHLLALLHSASRLLLKHEHKADHTRMGKQPQTQVAVYEGYFPRQALAHRASSISPIVAAMGILGLFFPAWSISKAFHFLYASMLKSCSNLYAAPANEWMIGTVGIWYKKAKILTIPWNVVVFLLTLFFSFTFLSYNFSHVLVTIPNLISKQSMKN